MTRPNKILNNKGFILPAAMMLGTIGMIFTLVPFTNLINREIRLDHRIAKTKARFNAESGLASIYSYFSLDSLGLDSMSLGGENISIDYTNFKDPVEISDDMGSYQDIILQETLNELSRRTERNAFAVGEANITSFGRNISVLDTMAMAFELESLSEYLYLTNHEHAGGAPGIYGTQGSTNSNFGGLGEYAFWRGKPCFGPGDKIGNEIEVAGFVQTNDPMLMCSTTGSTLLFPNTVYITMADTEYEDSDFNTLSYSAGEAIKPDGGNFDENFQGESGPDDHPNYIEKDKICFPMRGYWSTVSAANITIDASRLLERANNPASGERDKLIMTDVEFLSTGGFIITEYWYLIPPYQKAIAGDSNLDGVMDTAAERLLQNVSQLEGVSDVTGLCRINNAISTTTDQSSCDQFAIAMEDFHGKYVENPSGAFFGNNYQEEYMYTLNNNNGYNQTAYNRGYPGNAYGPTDGDPSTKEYPNGYGHTNLSHYDPHNFWRYYNFQNPTWEDATMRFGPYTTNSNPYDGTLVSQTTYPNEEAVIHIKGGPVTVHGTFKGRYTVVTSGHDAIDGNETAIHEGWSTYYRDAWNSRFAGGSSSNFTTSNTWNSFPVDTVYSNIWITGDLVNADTFGNNGPPQPVIDEDGDGNNDCAFSAPGDCGGSTNIMGLVSSANVIIANSPDNRDATGQSSVGVNVHASIVAFHESFVMHYWQHSINDAGNVWDEPPVADSRGVNIYGQDVTDHRGLLRLWGGIIQSYRGYMMRNASGPYSPPNNGDIGMDKDYYFDQNLAFPPPYFPYVSRCPDDGAATAAMTMISYQPVTSEIKAIYESVD